MNLQNIQPKNSVVESVNNASDAEKACQRHTSGDEIRIFILSIVLVVLIVLGITSTPLAIGIHSRIQAQDSISRAAASQVQNAYAVIIELQGEYEMEMMLFAPMKNGSEEDK